MSMELSNEELSNLLQMKEELFHQEVKNVDVLIHYHHAKTMLMNKALKDEDIRLGYMTVLDYLERYMKSYKEYYGGEP